MMLTTTTKHQQRETVTDVKKGKVTLQPIAMTIPNSHGVYSPSRLRPKKEVSYEEFLSRYADRPRKIRVCFDETSSIDTLLERSEFVTAYGFGLDCWYIVGSYDFGDGSLKDERFAI